MLAWIVVSEDAKQLELVVGFDFQLAFVVSFEREMLEFIVGRELCVKLVGSKWVLLAI